MKKNLLALFIVMSFTKLNAQLTGVALALYNECFSMDVTRGNYAVSNGVQTLATVDGNSFLLKWFPAGTTPSVTPIIVTLHGTGGTAFDEFYLWHSRAAAKGCGIIAVQYYRGAAAVAPNDYFDDNTIYTYFKSALTGISYPPNKALLHGFSRGSARSYAVAFKDLPSQGGNNYFCTIMSNAGKADSTYPIYNAINAGTYGHTLYTGKKWGMYCGGMDPNPARDGCVGMNSAKNWVIANGGTVGLYISDPALGHGGFHQTPAYIDSCLNYYLHQCYPVTTSQNNLEETNGISVFPNPTCGILNIKSLESTSQKTIAIYDAYGKLIYEKQFFEMLQIDTKSWAKGIYTYSLKNENNSQKHQKLIIQ